MTKKILTLILAMVLTLGLGTGGVFATGEVLGEGDIVPGILEEGDIVPGIIEEGSTTEGSEAEETEEEEASSEEPSAAVPGGETGEPETIDDTWVRVGLQYGSNAVSSCTISADSTLWIGSYTSTYGLVPEESLQNTSVNATISNGFIRLQGSQVSMSVERTSFYIMPSDFSGLITIDGKKYRGGVLLQVYNGKINVINCLTVREYLYGVIHNELSQSHPLEALKAQAVAARSFTATQMGKHSSQGFDLCASTDCQMYKGYASEYPKTTQAVDETEGLVIYSEGKMVSAYYYAHSGGHTLNSEDVWTKPLAYLRGVEDPYSPYRTWTITMPMSTIQQKLEAAGHYVGSLESVAITGRGAGNSVTAMEFRGTSGTVTIKKNSIRTLLGTTSIRSQLFEIGGDAQESSSGLSSGQSNSAEVSDPENILYRIGLHVLANAEIALLGSTSIELPAVSESDPEPEASSVVTGDSVTFTGAGYGHCVGMSQLGAVEMANQGFTFDQILKFYYTGIDVNYAY